jgi:hypothetical protein
MHDGLGTVIYSQRTYPQRRRTGGGGGQPDPLGLPGPSDRSGPPRRDRARRHSRSPTSDGRVGQYAPDQTDYWVLEEAANLFAGSVNGAGEPWRVVRIPQPDVYYIYMVLPVVRTYTNAFIANNVVLLPVYGLPEDEEAAAIFQDLLPGRTIHPIDATGIIAAGGAWHCVTMGTPSVTPLRRTFLQIQLGRAFLTPLCPLLRPPV